MREGGGGGKRGYLPRAPRYNRGPAVQNCMVLFKNTKMGEQKYTKSVKWTVTVNSCMGRMYGRSGASGVCMVYKCIFI